VPASLAPQDRHVRRSQPEHRRDLVDPPARVGQRHNRQVAHPQNKMGAFVLNGLIAAVVGMLYAGKFNSVDPTVLTGGELTVIAAAILGGTSLFGGSGYVAKSVVGTLILFTLSNGFNVLNIGSNYQNLVQGAVLVAAASLYTATSSKGRGFVRSRIAGMRRDRGAPPASPTSVSVTGSAAQSGQETGRVEAWV
jgi:D-xylose transport system permease protein